MANGYYRSARSICWDCEHACCGCSWSRRFKPVNGWTAIPTKLKMKGDRTTDTFIVLSCPQFKRDAVDYGMKWTNKKNTIVRRSVPKRSKP